MTDCDRAAELISAQLDGELTPEECSQLEEHLTCCPACQALQKDFQELHQILLDAAAHWTVEPPEDLTERVLEKVRQAKLVPLPAQKNRWRRWASLAAVLALVVLGSGVYVWGQGGLTAGSSGGGMALPQGDAAASRAASNYSDVEYDGDGPMADHAESTSEAAPAYAYAPEDGATAYCIGEPVSGPQVRAASGDTLPGSTEKQTSDAPLCVEAVPADAVLPAGETSNGEWLQNVEDLTGDAQSASGDGTLAGGDAYMSINLSGPEDSQLIAWNGALYYFAVSDEEASPVVETLPENCASAGALTFIGVSDIPDTDLETNCKVDSNGEALNGRAVYADPEDPTVLYLYEEQNGGDGSYDAWRVCYLWED